MSYCLPISVFVDWSLHQVDAETFQATKLNVKMRSSGTGRQASVLWKDQESNAVGDGNEENSNQQHEDAEQLREGSLYFVICRQ